MWPASQSEGRARAMRPADARVGVCVCVPRRGPGSVRVREEATRCGMAGPLALKPSCGRLSTGAYGLLPGPPVAKRSILTLQPRGCKTTQTPGWRGQKVVGAGWQPAWDKGRALHRMAGLTLDADIH